MVDLHLTVEYKLRTHWNISSKNVADRQTITENLTSLVEASQIDFHETFRKDGKWAKEEPITLWHGSG